MAVGIVIAACIIAYAAATITFILGAGWPATLGVLVGTGIAVVGLLSAALALHRRIRSWLSGRSPKASDATETIPDAVRRRQ